MMMTMIFYFIFILLMCATEPACEMTGFAVAKVMSVVTRQTLWGCCSDNEGAIGMLWFTAG